MSVLQQILGSYPGTGHYAFAEISADGPDVGSSSCQFDTATVVGSSITVTTSGVNIGRFTLNANGTYLFLGASMLQFTAATDTRFVSWRRNGGTNPGVGPLIGGSNYNGGVRPIQFMNFQTAAETATTFYTIVAGSGSTGTYKAGYSWAFIARLV